MVRATLNRFAARLFRVHMIADAREKLCAAGINCPLGTAQRKRLDIIRTRGILFIHIPKNAGISISHSLYGGQVGHQSIRYYQAVAPDIVKRLPRFAVVRDPVERFLSAFRFAKTGGTRDQPMMGLFAERYMAMRDVDELLDHLEASPSPYHFDYVFRPQSWFITDRRGRIKVDQLIRMDDMTAVESLISRHRGRPLPHMNRSVAANIGLDAHQVTRIRRLYRNDVRLYERLRS